MYEQGGVYIWKAWGVVIHILKCVCVWCIYLSQPRQIFFLPVEHGMVHALFRTKRQWSQIRSLHGFEMEIYRHLLHMLVSMVAFSFVVS